MLFIVPFLGVFGWQGALLSLNIFLGHPSLVVPPWSLFSSTTDVDRWLEHHFAVDNDYRFKRHTTCDGRQWPSIGTVRDLWCGGQCSVTGGIVGLLPHTIEIKSLAISVVIYRDRLTF